MKTLSPDTLPLLLDELTDRGYTVVGPTVRDGAIVYDPLDSTAGLPSGWTDEQNPGTYRIKKSTTQTYFDYNTGPHNWRKFLFPPRERLWSATRSGDGFTVEEAPLADEKYAFVGVRACDLAAIAVQDRIFLDGEHTDENYRARREQVFIVAVNCTSAGGTCFCSSTGTGPKAGDGFDIVLTEVADGDDHYITAGAANDRGEELLSALPGRDATKKEQQAAENAVAKAAAQMGRVLDTEGLSETLLDSYEHPRWDDVAKRCLACGNCTMVCPTCFCTTVEDTNDLTGDHAERWRRWDSCFTTGFSYIHGGSLRVSPRARYRQWVTHKLATWREQFGTSGCVGCGRCITWCPAGIDITEEVRAIRSKDKD